MRIPRGHRYFCVWILAACGCGPERATIARDPMPERATIARDPLDGQTPRADAESEASVDESELALDGRRLYSRNCAGCHNENGDGRGKTMLDLGTQARSFAQGGFAFGNTPEAIYKTITAGMPGSSLMPSFRGTLSDEERRAIVAFVLTLTPPQPEAAQGTELIVGSLPCVARGKLPAFAEKLPERPRGLLIGLPEGLTFEYRVDDVRLLGVRQGGFADRTDWNERGGGVLQPLGQVIHSFAGGDPPPAFSLAGDPQSPLIARLTSTWIDKSGSAGLSYELRDEAGQAVAEIEETVRSEPLSIGGAFSRQFRCRPKRPAVLHARLAGSDADGPFHLELGELGYGSFQLRGWYVRPLRAERSECVQLLTTSSIHTIGSGLELEIQLERSPVEWRMTFVTAAEVSGESFERWTRELVR
jgi:mono/diheme cytochrome c family protein